MRNRDGRRIYRLFATSKRSKRILSLVVIPLALLLSFFGSGRAVFADSALPATSIDVTFTNGSFSYNWTPPISYQVSYNEYQNNNYSVIQYAYRDVYLRKNCSFTFSPSADLNPNVEYTGFFQVSGSTYTIAAAPSNQHTVVDEVLFIDTSFDFDYDYIYNASSYVQTVNGNPSDGYSGKYCTYNKNIIIYASNIKYVSNSSSGPIYLREYDHFRVYYHSTDLSGSAGVSLSVTENNSGTGRGVFNRTWSEEFYAYNALEVQKQILSAINSTGGNIVTAINNAASQAHTDAGTAHNDAVALASQEAAEAAIAQSQAANQIDALRNDHSGTSQTVAAIENDYNTAESAASVAIDGAVHNYNSDLATVDNYDFNTFFTSQSTAATFWRDIGEYILNSSNLGFIASGVIITTLITLFVFLLRL